MAGRIAGITIEIGGDTTDLQKSLKSVDSQLKKTQSNLKDIDKLLKLDPNNTELLRQKQQELEKAIGLTKTRLEELKNAQSQVSEGSAEWDALQREIIATEQSLGQLEGQYAALQAGTDQTAQKTRSLGEAFREMSAKAAEHLQAVGKKLQDAGKSIEEFGNKLAPVSGAAAAIGTALLKMGYDAATGADDLNTLAKQTGISTAELQKMQYASDLIDVSLNDITGALKKMKPKMSENNQTFKDLGVSVTDADGNLRDATDVFYDTVEALSKIENETEKDQIAMELFGKGADSLAGIIDDGGQALKEYGEQAEELGVILDQDTLNALNEANDVIDQTKAQVKGTMAVIGSQVVPVLMPLLQKGAELVAKIGEKLRGLNEEQTETILKVVGVVAAAAPAIILIGKIVSGVGSLISAAGSLLGVLGNPAVLIIAALVAAGILLYKNWDKIKAVAETVKTSVVAAWNNLKTSVTNTVNALKTGVTTAWNNIKTAVTTAVNTLKTSVTTTWTNIKTSVSNTISAISTALDPLKTAIDNLKSTWSSAWDNINNKISDVSTTITATIDKIKEKFQPLIDKITALIDKFKELGGQKVPQSPSSMPFTGNATGNAPVAGNNVVINVYAAAGQNARQIAMEVQKVLVAQQIQKQRAYG